jgi:hypothetical protein
MGRRFVIAKKGTVTLCRYGRVREVNDMVRAMVM